MYSNLGQLKNCQNCRYLNLCGGGCRADALSLTKDLFEVDPMACSVLLFMEKEILPLLPENDKQMIKNSINQDGRTPKVFRSIKEIIEFYCTYNKI